MIAKGGAPMEACKKLSDPLIGSVIAGRFEVLALLGEGSMGAVYRGVELGTRRPVAIKVLLPHLIAHDEMRARFEREAAAAMRIRHPNAVRVYEHGVERGMAFLVMELLHGQDLFAELAARGRLSEERAVRIVIQIAGALGAAHAEGIVHRDLKPENVMLAVDAAGDRVKLLDFGIAKQFERRIDVDEDIDDITVAGALIGTPGYMAPEQCQGAAVTPLTDIYACGVLLYQLVTGHLPFENQNPMAAWIAHLNEAPRPPSAHLAGLHPGLEAAILKALEKLPANRQQSARELRIELLRVLPQLSKVEPSEARTSRPPPRESSPMPAPSVGFFSGGRAVSHVRPINAEWVGTLLPDTIAAEGLDALSLRPPHPTSGIQLRLSSAREKIARLARLRELALTIVVCVVLGGALGVLAYAISLALSR
jgi:eukaryotic-like serine/threonine-protein kinase